MKSIQVFQIDHHLLGPGYPFRFLCLLCLLFDSSVSFAGGQSQEQANQETFNQETFSQEQLLSLSLEALLDLKNIIVSGTTKPKTKINSTNAITTFNPQKLERDNYLSVVELVRAIPGFHAEDSGGETGNNIAPRGFPLSTQMEFTALQRDGMTIFHNQDVLFTQADRFTRLSSFIHQVEAVRGGASSLFVSNAPAGYINLISREGDTIRKGDFTLNANSNDGLGLQTWLSGPLNQQTTYALGAWYRENDSGRDPGYKANHGGELNANLKYTFSQDNSFSKFEFNRQNDHSYFFTPQPLTGSINNAKTIPGGMDIRSGTTGNSVHARELKLNNTPNGDIDLDVGDGNFAHVSYFGNISQYQLDNALLVKNHFRFSKLHTRFTGIINVGNALPLALTAEQSFCRQAGFLDQQDEIALSECRQAIAANNTGEHALSDANANGQLYYQVRDALEQTYFADQSNISSWNQNGLGIAAGVWHRNFSAENIQNNFQLQKKLQGMAGGTLHTSLGVNYSRIIGKLKDRRINTLQSIEPLPHRLNIHFTRPGGGQIASANYQGIQNGAHEYSHIHYRERTLAPYLDLEYQWQHWLFNFGSRYESLSASGAAEMPSAVAINTFANNSDLVNGEIELPFGSGQFRDFQLDYSEWAWTLAANIKVNDQLSSFARYSKGFRMPDVDKYMNITQMQTPEQILAFNRSSRRETNPASTVMAELGVKYSAPKYAAFITAYYAGADDLFFNVPTVVNQEVIQRQAFRNTETFGIETELSLNPQPGWYINLSYTYQKPEFVDTPKQEFLMANGATGSVDINGKLPVRVPETFGRLSSYYQLETTHLGTIGFNASYSFSGKRYADDANTAELPAYGFINLGVSFEHNSGYYLRLQVKNINNSEGLTEGDPRAGETVADMTPTFNARVILPKSYFLSVGKRF